MKTTNLTMILQNLGLNPKEAAIYVAAMELGTASAVSIIAKKANINRTTAYDILRHMGAPLGKRDFMGRMKLKA